MIQKRIGGRASLVTRRALIRPFVLRCAAVGLGLLLIGVPVVLAEHEVDHRFTVEGVACGADGAPASGVEVVVKDARISVLRTGLTDDRGYYKVTLHLHNDNKGDPIVVYLKDKEGRIQQEQHITAQFDPKDLHTERKRTVNFGSGCESLADESPAWLSYSAGAVVLAGGAWAGAKLLRKRPRLGKSHKGGKR